MDDVSKLQSDVSALATSEGRKVGTRGHDVAKGLSKNTIVMARRTEISIVVATESGV